MPFANSLVVGPSPTGAPVPRPIGVVGAPNLFTPKPQAMDANASYILWDNKLSPAGQSQPVQLALSDNTYERGTAKTFTITLSPTAINTIALLGNYAGHLITVDIASTTGGALSTIATLTPTDDRAIMIFIAERTVGEIRITTDQTSVQLSNISAGIALQMQRPLYGGHTPITMAQQTDYQSRRTETANFVSRNIIRKGLANSFQYKNISADWARSEFMPFKLAARKAPFFIAWRPEEYPAECAYAWTTGDINLVNQGVRDLMDIEIQVQAYGE